MDELIKLAGLSRTRRKYRRINISRAQNRRQKLTGERKITVKKWLAGK